MSITSKIAAELEEKRRAAQLRAMSARDAAYEKFPELSELDRRATAVAMDYTKKMLAGDDVRGDMQAALAEISRQRREFLLAHGMREDEFEPRYSCEKCDDTGRVDGKLCRCFKNRIIEENFKKSNLGDMLRGQSFDKFDLGCYSDKIEGSYPVSARRNMEKNLDYCTRFADRFDDAEKSILMTGGTGLGKTFLSTCIARELLKKGKSVIYISAVDFFRRIENSRFDLSNADIELFESCDLLIVDDLGAEAPGVYTTAVFSDILDKRVSRGKKLILSTNSGLGELEKMYGERVYSRIAGYFRTLIFFGDDIRVQNFLKGN